MEQKQIYEFLESLESEKKNDVLEAVKAIVKKRDDAEAKARTLETDAKQFEGLDIAKLKSDSETLEKLGGAEELQNKIAKAEGWENDKERIEGELSKLKKIEEQHKTETENWSKERSRLEIENETTAEFVKNFNTSTIVQNHAINNGFIVRNDEGKLCSVVDGTTTPLSDGGWEKLKSHADFADAVKTPSGGGVGGGANDSNGSDENGGKTATDMILAL